MKQFFFEILYLLGNDKKKIPFFIVLFLVSSLLDLVGLGIVGAYISLIANPNFLNEGILGDINYYIALGLQQDQLLIKLGLILFVIFLLKGILSISINKKIVIFSASQHTRLKIMLIKAYQNMPYQDFLNRNSSDYILTIHNYTQTYSKILQSILKVISDGVVGVGIIIMLLLTDWLALTLLMLMLGGVVVVYDILFRRGIRHFGQLSNEASVRMVQGIHEGIDGLKEIRILGKEQCFIEVIKNSSQTYADNNTKTQIITAAPKYLLEIVMVTFVVLLVTINIMIENETQAMIPLVGMFGIAAIRMMPFANIFSTIFIQIRFSRHAISCLYSDLYGYDEAKLSINSGISLLGNVEKFRSISLHDVRFTYAGAMKPALSDISLEVHSGESIGLIGSSGSGKTTLVDVLLGLHEPQQGEILYNDSLLKNSLTQWRKQVAYLPQQVFLIDNTLRRNVALTFDDEEIDDLLVYEALRQSKLLDFVDQLPNGVETMMGERGIRISGGQRQRVAVARAFYHGRDVLVMDEATSALDFDTEKEIVNEIKLLKGKITIIVIAHRLSTVQHCDRIYRLDNGKILSVGTPEEILDLAKT
jgi:ATP-binding cassette, subfamily B, bacterial PglK